MKITMSSDSTVSTAEEGEGDGSSSTLEDEVLVVGDDNTAPSRSISSSSPKAGATAAATTTTTTIICPTRHVTFTTIEVREYSMTMGDNPSVSGGIPVTISWDVQLSLKFDLNQFESVRQDARDIRYMRIPYQKRESIARSNGYTSNEIVDVLTDIEQIQISRRQNAYEPPPPPTPPSSSTAATIKQSISKFSFKNVFGGSGGIRGGGIGSGRNTNNTDQRNNKRFKFGYVLQPEDYAMLNVPDMTKVPISLCVDMKDIALITSERTTTTKTSNLKDFSCGADTMSISDCSGGSSSSRSSSHRRRRNNNRDRRSHRLDTTTTAINTSELTPSDPEFFAGQILLL